MFSYKSTLSDLARPINADAFQAFHLQVLPDSYMAFALYVFPDGSRCVNLSDLDLVTIIRHKEVRLKFEMQTAALSKDQPALYILGMVVESFRKEGLSLLFLRGVQDSLDRLVILEGATFEGTTDLTVSNG